MKFTATIGSQTRQVDPLNKLVLLTDIYDEDGNLFREDGHCWVKETELYTYYCNKERYYHSLPYKTARIRRKRENGNARFSITFDAKVVDYRKGQTLTGLSNISVDFNKPLTKSNRA